MTQEYHHLKLTWFEQLDIQYSVIKLLCKNCLLLFVNHQNNNQYI